MSDADAHMYTAIKPIYCISALGIVKHNFIGLHSAHR